MMTWNERNAELQEVFQLTNQECAEMFNQSLLFRTTHHLADHLGLPSRDVHDVVDRGRVVANGGVDVAPLVHHQARQAAQIAATTALLNSL